MDYLVNSFISLGLFIAALIPFGIGSVFGPITAGLGGLVSLVVCIPVCYYGFHNNLKRLRDIRGTQKDEFAAGLMLFIGLIIPYISAVVGLVLLFMEGAVTGNGNGTSGFEGRIQSFTISKPVTSEADQINNLEKLHKLKEDGVITEEEFQNYKVEALKKIA